LTIQLASPLISSAGNPSQSSLVTHILRVSTGAIFASLIFLGLPKRRKWFWLSIVLLALSAPYLLIGCGGGGSSGGNGNTSPTATATVLNVSSSSPALNAPVTLTAEVTANNGGGTPSGSVSFLDATNSLGSANLVNGKVSVTASALSIGMHSIAAHYQGNATYSASMSSPSAVDVTLSTQIVVSAADSLGNIGSANLSITVQ
jgi:hypothetical protein